MNDVADVLDVLIVGAGPAGSVAATVLARAGVRVAVRARMPDRLTRIEVQQHRAADAAATMPREPRFPVGDWYIERSMQLALERRREPSDRGWVTQRTLAFLQRLLIDERRHGSSVHRAAE